MLSKIFKKVSISILDLPVENKSLHSFSFQIFKLMYSQYKLFPILRMYFFPHSFLKTTPEHPFYFRS